MSRGHRKRQRFTGPQLLLVTDLVCMSLPISWERSHYRGLLTAAVISCLLFWSVDLYRPRLQPFVLDEIPILLGCLLASTAVVATLSAYSVEPDTRTTEAVWIATTHKRTWSACWPG